MRQNIHGVLFYGGGVVMGVALSMGLSWLWDVGWHATVLLIWGFMVMMIGRSGWIK
jgi:hypothetical protein